MDQQTIRKFVNLVLEIHYQWSLIQNFFNRNYIAFDAYPYFQEDLTLKSLNEALNYLKEIFSKVEKHFFQNLDKSPFINYFNKEEFNFNEFRSLLKFEGLNHEYDSGLLKNLKYAAPYNSHDIENFTNSSDLIFSQAALEHVRDLKAAFIGHKKHYFLKMDISIIILTSKAMELLFYGMAIILGQIKNTSNLKNKYFPVDQ